MTNITGWIWAWSMWHYINDDVTLCEQSITNVLRKRKYPVDIHSKLPDGGIVCNQCQSILKNRDKINEQ